jgi:hypothetical protein
MDMIATSISTFMEEVEQVRVSWNFQTGDPISPWYRGMQRHARQYVLMG